MNAAFMHARSFMGDALIVNLSFRNAVSQGEQNLERINVRRATMRPLQSSLQSKTARDQAPGFSQSSSLCVQSRPWVNRGVRRIFKHRVDRNSQAGCVRASALPLGHMSRSSFLKSRLREICKYALACRVGHRLQQVQITSTLAYCAVRRWLRCRSHTQVIVNRSKMTVSSHDARTAARYVCGEVF